MKIAFKKLALSGNNKSKLTKIVGIVEEYNEKGYILTLRQVYYQMVARGHIDNNIKEYDKIGNVVKEGRLAGIIDWNHIEDRTRSPKLPYHVSDINDAIDDTVKFYREDRQIGQQNYVELWVEKDAISNILYKKSAHYMIKLMVNRGYSSATAMFDSANRFIEARQQGKTPHLLYLGDHDPSGLDMIRDIRERCELFGVEPIIKHIGLTQPQIKQFDPPPYPAKIKDPRAGWYIKNYGETAWEVDALTPEVLHDTVTENIENLLDMQLFQKKVQTELRQKLEIRNLLTVRDDLSKVREELIELTDSSELRESNIRLLREHVEYQISKKPNDIPATNWNIVNSTITNFLGE